MTYLWSAALWLTSGLEKSIGLKPAKHLPYYVSGGTRIQRCILKTQKILRARGLFVIYHSVHRTPAKYAGQVVGRFAGAFLPVPPAIHRYDVRQGAGN
jgi:hypothetical protein